MAAHIYNVVNNVPNTPGGKLFDNRIGADFTKAVCANATKFIWTVFKQDGANLIRNDVPMVTVYISEYEGYACTNRPNINVSGQALDQFYYPRNMSKSYFKSLLYHELAHIFQWNGNGSAPGGLTEGIADYVVLKSGFYDKKKYAKPGSGKRWDQGYGVTVRFLEYCHGLSVRQLQGFTAALNMKMRNGYSDNYFVDLLGKPVDRLWREYKAKYGDSHRVDSFQDYSNSTTIFPGVEY